MHFSRRTWIIWNPSPLALLDPSLFIRRPARAPARQPQALGRVFLQSFRRFSVARQQKGCFPGESKRQNTTPGMPVFVPEGRGLKFGLHGGSSGERITRLRCGRKPASPSYDRSLIASRVARSLAIVSEAFQ
jgi:hypothetical protein